MQYYTPQKTFYQKAKYISDAFSEVHVLFKKMLCEIKVSREKKNPEQQQQNHLMKDCRILTRCKKTRGWGKAIDQESHSHANQALPKIIPSNKEDLTLNQKKHMCAYTQMPTHTKPNSLLEFQ